MPKSYERGHEVPITWFAAITTYFGYAVLILFGHIRDFFGRMFGMSRYLATSPPPGYAPLLKDWENFYTRRLYHRIRDCWERPVCSAPGGRITVVERDSPDGNKTMLMTKRTRECLNLGSYNYLGFADDWQTSCKSHVMPTLDNFNSCLCSARMDLGTSREHVRLEELVARYVGKEAALVYNMGFGTNSTTIPALVGRGSLIISDTMNHSSIVAGSRASGALVRTFVHNDAASLERVLRDAIARGMPRTHRPWRKILVMVEGIYSMEGEICNLKGIVEVVKRYGVYLYVDEAHSIGALGETGRGICEYAGVDPADVDILMGTFTKSFGGMGGYIAGDKALIQYLRRASAGSVYHNSLSTLVCSQVYRALRVIMGEDGTDTGRRKIAALRNNSNHMRRELIKMGCHVYGDYDSPIIPVMLYNPTKIAAFSREAFTRGLAVVVVGFPATPIVLSRTRICVSAGHTRKEIERALEVIEELVDLLRLRYANNVMG
jgi:serine palmitoyltransferase